MPLHETIQQRLAAAQKAGRPLDLLSSFKGVPVRYQATIEQIEPEAVVVRVTQHEAVCLALVREVVVLGEGGDEALRAEAAEVQLPLGRARLVHLRFADSRLGNRLMVRVEPKVATTVRLELAGQIVTGQIVDVSMGGLAVQVTAAPPEVPLKAGVTTPLIFALPSGAVKLVGLIRSARPEGDGRRLGIAFSQDAHVSVIVSYVLQRRVEILEELEQAYQARMGQA